MTDSIDSRVLEIVKNNADLEGGYQALSLDDQIFNLGITSRSFIELVVVLESEFNIEFEDESLDVRKFTTINDLIHYIKEHTAKN